MKLKPLLEKKEAIATSPNTNMTLHYDPQFTEVGEDGKPEFSFSITMSSVGGKDFYRTVANKDEEKKLLQKAITPHSILQNRDILTIAINK